MIDWLKGVIGPKPGKSPPQNFAATIVRKDGFPSSETQVLRML